MKNISTDRRDRILFYQKFDWIFYMRVSCIYMIALLGTASVLAARPTRGQGLEQEVTIGMEHESARVLLEKIEAVTDLNCIFKGELIDTYSDISFPCQRRTLLETLTLGLGETKVDFYLNGMNIVFLDRIRHDELESNKYSILLTELLGRTTQVSGTVKDKSGSPLPGVNVVVKGTTIGTSTDVKGNFSIEVPEGNETLVFSFIGLKTLEMSINGRTSLGIEMEADVTTLDEVVVNGGYYTTTDRTKIGSIVKVTSKDLANQPVTNPLMALQGRVPGLDITPMSGVPGSAATIQIRGRNSLRNNTTSEVANSPLYIVDGVPIDPTPIRSNSNSTSTVNGGYDPLSTIDVSNIESVEVLKDADATAIYGSRGANGVILITTKRGTTGNTNVDVNVYSGVGMITNRIDLLNTDEYLSMRREAFKNDNVKPGSADYDVNGVWDTTRYTNWQKELLGGKAKINDVQFGLSGGGENTSFRFNGGYHKETTIYSSDFGFERLSGSFNVNHQSANRRFRVDVGLNYGVLKSKVFEGSFVSDALNLAPNAPRLYQDDGTLNWEYITLNGNRTSTFNNPLAKLRNTTEMDEGNIIANTIIEYRISSALQLKSNFGFTDLYTDENIKNRISARPFIANSVPTTSSGFGSNKRRSIIIEPQLVYTGQFGDHNLGFVVGATWQESRSKSQLITASGYSSDLMLNSLDAAGSFLVTSDLDNEFKYTSVFLRATYDWKSRYLVSLTGRRDGSSRFSPGKRFGNFGSVGAAWILSNESFFSAFQPVFSHTKFRGSVGVTGNDQIGDYKYIDAYIISDYTYQGGSGFDPSALYNPDFSWEETRKIELAFEAAFFRDRIFLELDWYRNRSSNQLVDYQLPSMTGFESVFRNFPALVENSGVEGILRVQCINRENWKWNMNFNISKNSNKLVEFRDLENSPYAQLYVVGKSLSLQRLYEYQGVNAETGRRDFVDRNTDGVYGLEDQIFGPSLDRKYFGGLNNSIRYRSIELSFLLQFSKQSKLAYVPISSPGARNANMPVDVLNRWRQEGDVAEYPKFSRGFEVLLDNLTYMGSTGVFSDASFIRLKSLLLSYQLPSRLLSGVHIDQAQIFVQGFNLWTSSNYNGFDPETGMGVPPLRMMSVGLRVRL
jgi:TonB-dependent starch-binding outer membrane protein SusC